MKICKIAGCRKKYLARGFCGMHYRRVRQHGSPHTVLPTGGGPGRVPRPLADRFEERVNKIDGGCWEWTGCTNAGGYGLIGQGGRGGKPLLAHRVSWELNHGPIPEGLQALHACDNPCCVKPEHLYLGTHEDNMRDIAWRSRKLNGTLH
jgi:hypothetical protein